MLPRLDRLFHQPASSDFLGGSDGPFLRLSRAALRDSEGASPPAVSGGRALVALLVPDVATYTVKTGGFGLVADGRALVVSLAALFSVVPQDEETHHTDGRGSSLSREIVVSANRTPPTRRRRALFLSILASRQQEALLGKV